MYTYHHIARFVAPKIEALREAEGKLRVANAKLHSKEEELAKVEADLQECQGRLNAAKKKKQDLQVALLWRGCTQAHAILSMCLCL